MLYNTAFTRWLGGDGARGKRKPIIFVKREANHGADNPEWKGEEIISHWPLDFILKIDVWTGTIVDLRTLMFSKATIVQNEVTSPPQGASTQTPWMLFVKSSFTFFGLLPSAKHESSPFPTATKHLPILDPIFWLILSRLWKIDNACSRFKGLSLLSPDGL